jgi:anhydro-N-acetylmuramic acid kinase
MNDKKQYIALGIMSGTSLDGLDLALCNFYKNNLKWDFEIIKAETVKYSEGMKIRLATANRLSGFELIRFHKEYGKFIGKEINKFLEKTEKPSIIASHGHTVFHRPEMNLTFQLGDGAFIAAETGITTVSDFRNLDTALGGQGAPLVPAGDELLFSEYQFCLNLGGIANISFKNSKNKRTAFDICPVNIIANEFASKLGAEFDRDGNFGKSGEVDYRLLNELNEIEFYVTPPPKSLGKEYIDERIFPIFRKYPISTESKLRTFYEHTAVQIASTLNKSGTASALPDSVSKILITGGGAHNTFVIERLEKYLIPEIVVPPQEIINFKEALIFAFLGVLRIENTENCFSSVTGASKDNFGGIIHKM